MTVLHDAVHTAQKTYNCDTLHLWQRCGYGEHDVDESDWKIVQDAVAADWKIVPGQKYRKVVYVDGGVLCTYRGGKEMDDLCGRLDLFDE